MSQSTTCPMRSPFSLIQEDLFPNRWLIIVSCMMLNQTSRKQVDKVLPEFIQRWQTPEDIINASLDDIQNTVKPLGFKKRRSELLVAMSQDFLCKQWKNVIELRGVGEYAARAYSIFCLNDLGETEPNDGALKAYWKWRKSTFII